ncbi:MAG: glycosyltransferase family 2 protein [Saprospiraceae bacterium]|nr:glycosyltransferase family 2 protein [Saprospiraceae bacterium]
MNKTISRYLHKNILFLPQIEKLPHPDVQIIVVIPCFNEPNVSESILSIAKCKPPKCHVEIIVSINAGEQASMDSKARNMASKSELLLLKDQLPSWLHVFPIVNNNLTQKKAGVGLGRKIGMDEAVRRFVDLHREDGIIVCFDADSACEENYLRAIEAHFENLSIGSASIDYAHPITGDEFPDEIYNSIIEYELHLRYFIWMQKQIHLPYAFHTVGSSMACIVSAYCAVGGMNQRKAGEDFYFIHKLVKYGKHSELNHTRVLPSPRISDRVPFGTGRAVGEMQDKNEKVYFTYAPDSFFDLKEMVDQLERIYTSRSWTENLPLGLTHFLTSINADKELNRILKNTSDFHSFYKIFWHWFDAFVLMKYLHFVRDAHYPDIPVREAINRIAPLQFASSRDALLYFREMR